MKDKKRSSRRVSGKESDAKAPERGGVVKSKQTSTDYKKWIAELKERYRATQIKAAIAVNSALIEFYWNLGKDISEKYPGKKRGIDFFGTLSRDLNDERPNSGLSVANIRYAHRFYEVYASYLQQVAERMTHVPRGHHMLIIDKCHAPIGLLVCKDHNRILAKLHLDELGLPMGITDYEIKKVLPTQAQLAKCYAEAEAQIAAKSNGISIVNHK